MQKKDTKSSHHPAQTLTTAEVADRMGLTTRQLQDLRLRGIGPPIVQRGLSIHYELADVCEIERHEAMAIFDQVLASDRPLTLLRTMAEHGSFKVSPILQQVSGPTSSPAIDPTPAPSELPEPARDVIGQASAPEPPSTGASTCSKASAPRPSPCCKTSSSPQTSRVSCET